VTEQKYCPNCGKPNLPDAAYCANCGAGFGSASPAPPRPVSSAVRPTAPNSSGQQPPYSPPPQPRRRFKKRYVLYGLVVLLVLGMAVSAMSGGNNQSQSAVSSTPASTAQAPAAQATPSAAPVAPSNVPSGIASDGVLTNAQLAVFDNGMVSDGYTITQHLTANGTAADGSPMYSGQMVKYGVTFDYMLISCTSSTNANSNYQNMISTAQGMGFSGSYTVGSSDFPNNTQWIGTMTDPNTGLTMGALAEITSGTNIVAVLIGE